MKNILIIGGMGPQASLLLHKRIIDRAVLTGAKENKDFPAITHLSIPVPDFIHDVSTKKRSSRHDQSSTEVSLVKFILTMSLLHAIQLI